MGCHFQPADLRRYVDTRLVKQDHPQSLSALYDPKQFEVLADVIRLLESLEITECFRCGGRFFETIQAAAHPPWLGRLDTFDSFGWQTHGTGEFGVGGDFGEELRECEWCRLTEGTWFENNDLYCGPPMSCLEALTELEELLIAPAHCAVQVWTLSAPRCCYQS